MTMTTTIPVTTLPLLLLLLSSASISYAKPPPPPTFAEQCPIILSKAIEFDTDATGGLNPTEFANFWSDLIGCGSSEISSQQLARDASNNSQPRTASAIGDSSTDSSSKQIYNTLLCQCHYTFHHDLQCCDDTATADDDDAPTELAIREDEDPLEIWTEVSLEGFAEEREGGDDEVEGVEDIDMSKYSKEFCRNVIYALEKQGIVLGEDFASGWNNATITLEEGNSTEVELVVIGGDETAATTTTSSTTTTDAPETEATVTTTTPTRVTTVASTATTVAAETTSVDAFDVTFVGSTNGKLTASSDDFEDDFEDVTIAFWTVSLEILEDITTNGRRLNWDFGLEAAIYFESVVMDVKDIGMCRLTSCCIFLASITTQHNTTQHVHPQLHSSIALLYYTRLLKWARLCGGRITLSSIHEYSYSSIWWTT